MTAAWGLLRRVPRRRRAPAGRGLMFITNGSSDWWTTVEKGMYDGAKEFGAQVEMRRSEGEPAQQIQRIEDVLSLPDVQGVAISVLEAESPGIADKMRELQAAGKVVIAIDSTARRMPAGPISAPSIARRAKWRERRPRRCARKGARRSPSSARRPRPTPANAGRGSSPVRATPSGYRPSRMRSRSSRMEPTRRRPSPTFRPRSASIPTRASYLGLWSYNAHFIAEELAKFPDLRKKVTVVTFDLDEAAVDDLAKGAIDVTVCQNPYQMGYLGVRLLKALIDKDQKTIDEMLPGGTDSIDTGVRVIVPRKDSPVKGDNVIDIDEMKKWLASKGLKSS